MSPTRICLSIGGFQILFQKFLYTSHQEVNSRRSPMQRELRLLITYLSYRNLLYIVFKISKQIQQLVTGEMEIKQIFILSSTPSQNMDHGVGESYSSYH